MNKYKVKIEEEILPNSFTLDELIESGLLDDYDENIKVSVTNESTWYIAQEFPFQITENPKPMKRGYIINEDGTIRRLGTTTPRLELSNQNLFFSEIASVQTITITANSSWNISDGVASWVHLTKNVNSLTVQVDKNYNSTYRTNQFKIKSGSIEKLVNITQSGSQTTITSNETSNENGCYLVIIIVFFIWLLSVIFG